MSLTALALAAQLVIHGPVANYLRDQPSTAADIQRIESAIRATLKDPDSAKFDFHNGFVEGTYRDFMRRKFHGRITCGTVNAKNGYGGYAGPEAVAVVIAISGDIIEQESDDEFSNTVNHGFVAEQCRNLGLPTD